MRKPLLALGLAFSLGCGAGPPAGAFAMGLPKAPVITRHIVRAMAVKLTEAEQARIGRAPTGVLEAYDLVLRGNEERKKTTRESNAEARRLFSSLQQAFLNLRRGRPGKLPPPVDDLEAGLDHYGRAMLADALSCSVVGGQETIRNGVQAFVASTGADELTVTAQLFDHAARKRSFEILAQEVVKPA